MTGYTVDRNQRKDYRGLLDIGLELRVLAVGLVLAEFESACPAEHHIDDTDISERGDYPLPEGAAGSEADNEASCPHQDFSEIVRAADYTIEAGVHESSCIYFLCSTLLSVSNHFDEDSGCSQSGSDPRPDLIDLGSVLKIVEVECRRTDLTHIKKCAGYPYHKHNEDRLLRGVFRLIQDMLVGSGPLLTKQQEESQTYAVYEKYGSQNRDRQGDDITEDDYARH